MKCNSCDMVIEGNWKYCPNCSKRVKDNKKLIISVSVIVVVIIFFIVISIINKMAPVDEKYINRSLSKKYGEKFSDIALIKSVENPDQELDCDGSSFGTIKGEGSKEYYKIHSNKNDIDFFAYYDTTDKDKTIYDFYEVYLNRSENILKVYDITKKYLNQENLKFAISYYDDSLYNFSTRNHLESFLNDLDEEDIEKVNSRLDDTFYETIYINVDEKIIDFSKSNYNNLVKLNDEIGVLREQYYFSIEILFNDDSKIKLDDRDGEPCVYVKHGKIPAWEESLDEFLVKTEIS